MAAPKGNQFWKIRSKHGRDKLFATPELLLTAAYEYFEWCDKNPWLKQETTIKPAGVESKETPTARPYTISGLCIYLHASEFMKLYNSIRIISLKSGWHYIANRKGRMTNLMSLEEATEMYRRMVNIVRFR